MGDAFWGRTGAGLEAEEGEGLLVPVCGVGGDGEVFDGAFQAEVFEVEDEAGDDMDEEEFVAVVGAFDASDYGPLFLGIGVYDETKDGLR